MRICFNEMMYLSFGKKKINKAETVVKTDHSKDYDVILLLNTDVFCALFFYQILVLQPC